MAAKDKLAARVSTLEERARETRIVALQSLYQAQSGHPGPSLSVTDLIVSLLFDEMNYGDPATMSVVNPSGRFLDGDRFILSKGHAAPAWYGALAVAGYVPTKEVVDTLRQAGSRFEGHPVRWSFPTHVDSSTGSLGQGLSVLAGMAFDAHQRGLDRGHYVIIGDGESDEGQIAEAREQIPRIYSRLGRIVAITDVNGFQNDGPIAKGRGKELARYWKIAGWNVLTVDGHDMKALLGAYGKARMVTSKPTMIMANTVKGKGVPFMEDDMGWHSKAMNQAQYGDAMQALGGQ
jgi:transketolase